uniref:Nodulin homeobox n=1 Tax=Cucumis melo TaxID=3656 RepID=A0A9I9DLF0_CUCME
MHLAGIPKKRYPTGFLQLNAMRLADIFSDDSNFRSYITVNFTKVLTAVFSLSHGDFLSSWCSSDLPVKEEDATLEYDSFAAAGWVLDNFFSSGILHPKNLDFTLIPSVMAPASYAHQRTSLFVKVIANLHCFVPSICEEQERNLFLHGFVDCLKMDIVKALPGSDGSKATNVCRNLRSLLSQAESLIPNFLNEEDVQLLRPVTTVFLPLRGEPIRFKGSVKFLCWQEGLNQSLSDIIYGGGRNHNPKGDYTPRKLRSQGFALPPLSRRGLKAVHNRLNDSNHEFHAILVEMKFGGGCIVFYDQLQKAITFSESEGNRVQSIDPSTPDIPTIPNTNETYYHFQYPFLLGHSRSLLLTNSLDQLSALILIMRHLLISPDTFEMDAQSVEGGVSPLVKELSHLDNGNGNLKEEGMSETSAFQEIENCVETERGGQGDTVLKEPKSKDEDESERNASGIPKGDERDIQNVETSGSDTNSTRGRNDIKQTDIVDSSKSNENAKETEQAGSLEEEKIENVHSEEKIRRKRKRTVMNEKQISVIERALLDEPEMQRNPASIQFWADELIRYDLGWPMFLNVCAYGMNRLNNRKARLARTARDSRATLEADNAIPDKQGGIAAGSCDSPDSPCEDKHVPNTGRDRRTASRTNTANNPKNSTTEFNDSGPTEFVHFKPGQYVILVDVLGEEIAKGKVHQVHGKWYGRNLEELETLVIDIDELKADKNTVLPYPYEATGTSFHEAETKIGVMRKHLLALLFGSRIFKEKYG